MEEGCRRTLTLDTSEEDSRHWLPPLSQPGARKSVVLLSTLVIIYCPDTYQTSLLVCPYKVPHLPTSSNIPVLVNGIQPHQPCPRDPAHLPRGINIPFILNWTSSLRLFLCVCAFFAFAFTSWPRPCIVPSCPGQDSHPLAQPFHLPRPLAMSYMEWMLKTG